MTIRDQTDDREEPRTVPRCGPTDLRIARLEREVVELRLANDILRAIAAHLVGESDASREERPSTQSREGHPG